MQLIVNHYLEVVDCWSYSGLLGIHSSLSNFNHSSASTNSASHVASCCLVSTKFQSFKHTRDSIVSGLKPLLLSDITLPPTKPQKKKKASDATVEIGTNNISQAIMKNTRYLF